MAEVRPMPGLMSAFARFYVDPRGSMRRLLDRKPSEATLLIIMVTGILIVMAGRVVQIQLLYANAEDRADILQSMIYSMLFLMPLFYYAFAAIGSAIARACGGQGGWRDGRAAFFWAVLVAAPVQVLSAVLPLFLAGVPPEVSTVTAQIGGVFFAWALAQCFAEAFGFARTWLVFVLVCMPFMLIWAAAWLMRG